MEKQPLKKNMNKTTLCSSVMYKSRCQHGNMCRYAHSIDELNILRCRRGFYCDNDECQRQHPRESLEMCMIRIGKFMAKADAYFKIVPKMPEMLELSRLIEKGKGMGLHENGITEPIDTENCITRMPGKTNGLGTDNENIGKNNMFSSFCTSKTTTISMSDTEMVRCLELALAMGNMNITIVG